MKWSTLRITEKTKKKLRERINASNDDQRIQLLLEQNSGKIEKIVEEKIEELQRGY